MRTLLSHLRPRPLADARAARLLARPGHPLGAAGAPREFLARAAELIAGALRAPAAEVWSFDGEGELGGEPVASHRARGPGPGRPGPSGALLRRLVARPGAPRRRLRDGRGRAFALCALAAAGPDAPPSGVLTARPPLLLPPFLTGQRQVFFRSGRDGRGAGGLGALPVRGRRVRGGRHRNPPRPRRGRGAQAGLLASTALFKARLERRARTRRPSPPSPAPSSPTRPARPRPPAPAPQRDPLRRAPGRAGGAEGRAGREGLEELCSRSAAALGPILRVHRVFVWDYTDASYASGAGYPRGAWTSPAIFAPGGPRERVGERLEKLEAPVVRALAAALDESPEGVFRCGSVGEALLRRGPSPPPGSTSPPGRPSRAQRRRARPLPQPRFVCVSVEGARGRGRGGVGPEDVALLRQAAHQLGVAMAHARLVARFREQNARLEAQLNYSRLFQAITREIHQARGVREVFEIGARMVREALRCSRCRVTCLDDFSLDAVSVDPEESARAAGTPPPPSSEVYAEAMGEVTEGAPGPLRVVAAIFQKGPPRPAART
eukprot:tig00000802_g4252.t1